MMSAFRKGQRYGTILVDLEQHRPIALWGDEFWSDGYFGSTVGKHGDDGMIAKSVQNQGKECLKLHRER